MLAEYNENRTRNLYEANSVSGQEMLLAATQLERAKATARIAELRFARAAVAAPYAGLVTERYVEVGQQVMAGTPVARIVDPYTLKLAAYASDRQVRNLEEGAPVTMILGRGRAHHGIGHRALGRVRGRHALGQVPGRDSRTEPRARDSSGRGGAGPGGHPNPRERARHPPRCRGKPARTARG